MTIQEILANLKDQFSSETKLSFLINDGRPGTTVQLETQETHYEVSFNDELEVVVGDLIKFTQQRLDLLKELSANNNVTCCTPQGHNEVTLTPKVKCRAHSRFINVL